MPRLDVRRVIVGLTLFTSLSAPCTAQGGRVPSPPAKYETRENSRDGATMVLIPAGDFRMGIDDGRRFGRHASPLRRIFVSAFMIYKEEVSVQQFRLYLRSTGRANRLDLPNGWRLNYPTGNVTWKEALDYCRWAGGSLPTEAQWERAARGVDSRLYTWGDAYDSERVYAVDSLHPNFHHERKGAQGPYYYVLPMPVRSMEGGASPFGLVHMLGNVAEWCYDAWDEHYFEKAPFSDPVCTHSPGGGPDLRIVRGGSYNSDEPSISATTVYRGYARSADRVTSLGFRCVIPVGSPRAARSAQGK